MTTTHTKIFSDIVTNSQGKLLKPLWFFLRQRYGLQSVSLLLSIVVSALETLSVGLVFPILGLFIDPKAASTSTGFLMNTLQKMIVWIPIQDPILAACTFLLVAASLKFCFSLAGEYWAAYVGGVTLHGTRKDLLKKFYRFPYSFFLDHKQGDLKHLVLLSTQRISHCLWVLTLTITETFKILALLGLLIIVNPRITLSIAVLGIIFYLLMGLIFQKISYNQGKLFAVRQMEMANILDEILTGIKHITLFRAFPHWMARFNASSVAQLHHHMKQRIVLNMPKNILETGIVIVLVATLALMKWLNPVTNLSNIPFLGMFGMAFIKLWPSLHMLNRSRLDLMTQLPDIEFVYTALTSSISEHHNGTRVFSSLQDAIRFNNVTFSYGDSAPLLDDFSLNLEKNSITAIVGRSGEGKTTLINLLSGLYEPQKGSIQVNGHALSEYDIDTWRAQIGFVSQESFLFNGSIRENILFGQDSYTEEQIRRAARIATADEFIEKLSEGYQTMIGDRGVKLSGGQQQRIAIARAVLRNPQILILDEATSSLDNISEKLVQQAIFQASKDRTVLLIAHRLSTIQNADKIVVIQNGRCIEEGTHQRLLQENGTYSRLIKAQIFNEAVEA